MTFVIVLYVPFCNILITILEAGKVTKKFRIRRQKQVKNSPSKEVARLLQRSLAITHEKFEEPKSGRFSRLQSTWQNGRVRLGRTTRASRRKTSGVSDSLENFSTSRV